MKIIRNIEVPTGNIIIGEVDSGLVEFLSIGDYGKEVNLKCDAMGLTGDIDKVTHGQMLPLTEKWVVTISTQHGCSMGCSFCDVPLVGAGKNVSMVGLIDQVKSVLELYPEITSTKRLNIHYARMGEPTFNNNVLKATEHLLKSFPQHNIHPVVSTMMPNNNVSLGWFLAEWMWMKNSLMEGNAGLQLSINSTNEMERDVMFGGCALGLSEIAAVMKPIPAPEGRKITLNFAVADYEIDPDVLLKHFSPEHYIIKLTPMHTTKTAAHNMIKTDGDYTTMTPYSKHEEKLKSAGYDVLVFIASKEEDLGRITCGNAILSGTLPLVDFKELQPIKGANQ